MYGQIRLKDGGTITMEDDGTFTSSEAPEFAKAAAGIFKLYCMQKSHTDSDLCRGFLTETAKLLGAEVINLRPHDPAEDRRFY